MPLFNAIAANWYLAHPALLSVQPAGASARTAQTTYLHDVWNPYTCVVTGFSIAHGGVSAGNLDMGIYDVNGNLLCHVGSTAASAINTTQTINLAAPFLLPAGRYTFGFWVDNSLDTYFARVSLSPVDAWGMVRGSTGTNAGGLAANFAGMGGVSSIQTFVPFLAHLQGVGF